MMFAKNADGFTLTEVLISLILLSIITIGSFKSSHFIHSASNQGLIQFRQTHDQQNLDTIRQLKMQYPDIQADSQYPHLDCLIRLQTACYSHAHANRP